VADLANPKPDISASKLLKPPGMQC